MDKEKKYATERDKATTYEVFEGEVPGSVVLCDKDIDLSMEERFFIDGLMRDPDITNAGEIKGAQVRKNPNGQYNVWLMKDYNTQPTEMKLLCDAIKERVDYNAPDNMAYVIITPVTPENPYFRKHLQYKKNTDYIVEF